MGQCALLGAVALGLGCGSASTTAEGRPPGTPVTSVVPPPAPTNATKFATALQVGDINAVNQMLDSGTVDVNFRFNPRSKNVRRNGGVTQGVFAFDEKTMDNAFPLFVAAENGRTEVVRVLIERGADVDLRTAYGATALYIACQEGHTEIVNFLLAKGADVTAQTEAGWNALIVASYMGWDEVVRALVKKGGAKPDQKGRTRMIAERVSSTLVFQTNGIFTVEVAPLYVACRAGKVKAVAALLESGADPNVTITSETASMSASPFREGMTETALDAANEFKNAELIELLTRAGAKTGVSAPSPLPCAKAQDCTGPKPAGLWRCDVPGVSGFTFNSPVWTCVDKRCQLACSK